tara:strand:- start:389 stop:622 length:234 start_codon:yes stop_codon:yes gene_type:complete
MNKRKKLELSSLAGGIGANVIDGDINTALKVYKWELKQSGKLQEVYNRKVYIKPSVTKRVQADKAKYLQRRQSLSRI